MLDAIGGGKRDEGLKIAGEVTGEYADTPYADQANLVLARLDVDTGNLAGAEARLATIAVGVEGPGPPDRRAAAPRARAACRRGVTTRP